ncbi:cytochrome C oxidase subunit IV family protein [soil metagenome]
MVTPQIASSTPPGTRIVTYVWVALSVITVISWWLGHGPARGDLVASVPITVAVLTLGLLKSRLIIRYFMEVRTAPIWLRIATDAWLIAFWGAVLGIYLY